MLVLARKQGEKVILLDGKIKIHVLEIQGNRVKLGFDAPKDITIDREEIWISKQEDREEIWISKQEDREDWDDINESMHYGDERDLPDNPLKGSNDFIDPFLV